MKLLRRLWIPFVLLMVFGTLWYWMFHWEPARFVVNRQEVALHTWTPELNGLRVLLLSDIHLHNNEQEIERLKNIVGVCNMESPDLVLLLGDYLGRDQDPNNASPETIADILKHLKARYGVYSILGNHDWWVDGPGMRSALKNVGIPVLENDNARVKIHGRELNLYGLPDWNFRRHLERDPREMPEPGEPTIVLSHNPVCFDDPTLPYELMVAGHTHGGQIQIPLFGPLLSFSKYHIKYPQGWYEKAGRKLFVTSGIGNSIMNVRFCCPPEIVIVTLRSAEENSTAGEL